MCVGHIILPPGADIEDMVFVCVVCHMETSGSPTVPYYVMA